MMRERRWAPFLLAALVVASGGGGVGGGVGGISGLLVVAGQRSICFSRCIFADGVRAPLPLRLWAGRAPGGSGRVN